MEHLKMHSMNKIDENINKIATLFPNCVTEAKDENGEVVHKIDFDMLKQELSSSLIEGREERYQFTWPDKKQAILTANATINKTLRPCREESVDFDNTENLYIEGDNLEVLKLLQETYLGKIKLIYIDPPYNTGNDFVYEDDFAQEASAYIANSGQTDEEGNRLVANTESNGRFHTDWLNMMYPRLKLARDLLIDDGVIFISIADEEVDNLKKMCSEIFGESNFQGHIHWRRRHNQPNDKTKMLGLVAEHILVYSKNADFLKSVGVGKIDITGKFSNPDNDPKGPWATKPWKVGSDQNGSHYKITTPTGVVYEEDWMGEESTFKELLAGGRIQFPDGGNGSPRKKYYQSERAEEGQCATNWWTHEQFGHNQGGNDCLTRLFGVKNVFSNPKPLELIRGIMQVANVKDKDIVLDFFSGSSTTAHQLLNFNLENSICAKFIMVQYKENLDESIRKADSKAKKQIQVSIDFLDTIKKPHFITEIGKERIRRAGKIIKEEAGENARNLDIGFRVLKCDTTNMEDVYYTPDHVDENTFFKNNIKEDRTPEDLLFQVMLDVGILLSSKIETKEINGKKVFYVDGNYLMACFDDTIEEKTVTEIAKQKPYYFVMRDPSNATNGDSLVTNFEQIFTTYSPDTVRKVL